MTGGPATDNPYQPPAISDEPIAKTEAASPNTTPHLPSEFHHGISITISNKERS